MPLVVEAGWSRWAGVTASAPPHPVANGSPDQQFATSVILACAYAAAAQARLTRHASSRPR